VPIETSHEIKGRKVGNSYLSGLIVSVHFDLFVNANAYSLVPTKAPGSVGRLT